MAGQEIMLISSTGTLVRTPVDEISVLGRNTQGVRLIRLAEGERLVGIERIESLDGGDGGDGGEAAAGSAETQSTDDSADDATHDGPNAGDADSAGEKA
jgi:DNA gyrase subunit A